MIYLILFVLLTLFIYFFMSSEYFTSISTKTDEIRDVKNRHLVKTSKCTETVYNDHFLAPDTV